MVATRLHAPGPQVFTDVARRQTKTGKSHAYWYYFTHVSPMPDGLFWAGRPALDAGAYHGGEIVYLFDAFPLQTWAWRPMDLELGKVMSSMWVQLAKTGDPNGAGLPEWPKYGEGDPLIHLDSTITSGPDTLRPRYEFLLKGLPPLRF